MKRVYLSLVVIGAIWSSLSAEQAAGGQPARHVLYLHGRIVQEQQDARPRHPEYGYYELQQILETFRQRGFAVSGDIRPKSASVSQSADRTVAQVRTLLDEGVPGDRVLVIGASMGASIALLASTRLQNPEVRFAVLGMCLSASIRAVEAQEGKGPGGRVLSIRETSDDLTEPCEAWATGSKAGSPLVVREIVLQTGLKHGFLYRPLPDWVNPVVEWAEARSD